MNTILDYLDRLRAKPRAARRSIAFGVAGTLCALIGVVWLTGSVAAGTYALRAGETPTGSGAGNVSAGGNGTLAGAAASLQPSDQSPQLEVVGSSAASSSAPAAEQTVVPF
jgi:hypothetical protein